MSWKGRNYNFQIRHFTVQQTGQVVDDIVIYRGGVFLGGFDLGPVLVGGYASNAEIPFGVTWELRKWFKAHGYPLEVRIDSRGYDLGKLAEVLGTRMTWTSRGSPATARRRSSTAWTT